MRKLTILFVSAFALLASGMAAAEVKIAAIRSGELIMQSPQFKSGQDKMKVQFDKRQKDLENDAKKFQEDVKKFQKEADLLSPSDRAKQEKDLSSRQVDLNYKQRQLQEDVQNTDRQLTQDMQAKIKDVIAAVAKEKGYDLIVQDPVFVTPAVDITDAVLKKLQASGSDKK